VVEAVVYAVDVAQPSVPACPLPIAYSSLGEARHVDAIGEKTVAEVEGLYLYLMPTRCYGSNDVLALAWEGETIGRADDACPYTSVMTNNDTILEEAMVNLKEAGQRIRATQSLMRSQGMIDDADYRELVSRLSTSLAMVEAAYMEARRRG
jgi:hypothetical protein